MSFDTVKLVIGLGNPGSEYEKTRHNVGFEVIDLLRTQIKKRETTNRCRSEVDKVRYASKTVFMQKPLTYMNLSGEAVKGLCRQEKITADEILVIYDCLDLPAGTLRVRQGGSSGGQKGMQSIIDHLGSDSIKRIRIGIGSEEREDTSDFVLSRFTEDERKVMDSVISTSADAVKCAIRFGVTRAMNLFNGLSPNQCEEK